MHSVQGFPSYCSHKIAEILDTSGCRGCGNSTFSERKGTGLCHTFRGAPSMSCWGAGAAMRTSAPEPSLSTLSQDLLVGFPETPDTPAKAHTMGDATRVKRGASWQTVKWALGVLCFRDSDDVFYCSCDSGDPSGTPGETRGAECLGTRAGTGQRKEAARPGRAATGLWSSDLCPACSQRFGHQ